MKKLLALLLLLACSAQAQPTTTFPNFLTGQNPTSIPLGAGDLLPVIQGGVTTKLARPWTSINGVTCYLTASCTIATAPGSITLNDGHMLVGNGSNIAADVAISGVLAITDLGVTTLNANAVVTAAIANANVTYAKIQNEATVSLLGNPTGAPAAPSEITLGSGLSFSGSTLVATGSGGTVTSVIAGTGLSGGTITTTGTIALADTAVTPAAYTNANITVDQQGRITAASNGSGGSGTVTSVAFSVPATSIFGTSGSPVTTSGTLGLTTTGTSGGIPYFSSTSQLASSALLTANAITLGGGAGAAPVSLGSLGNTVQLLHGNPSGPPSFSQLVTADITAANVTYSKLQNEAAVSLLGNPTGGSTSPSEITLGSGLAFSGTTLVATGSGGTVTSVTCNAGLTGGAITTTGTCALDVANANTWTATQSSTPQTLTISTSTFTPAAASGNNIKFTLTAACPCTFANPSGSPIAGTSGVIEITQGTGGQTIGTWGSSYLYSGGTSTIALSTGSGNVDTFSYYVRDSTHIVLTTAALNATH